MCLDYSGMPSVITRDLTGKEGRRRVRGSMTRKQRSTLQMEQGQMPVRAAGCWERNRFSLMPPKAMWLCRHLVLSPLKLWPLELYGQFMLLEATRSVVICHLAVLRAGEASGNSPHPQLFSFSNKELFSNHLSQDIISRHLGSLSLCTVDSPVPHF